MPTKRKPTQRLFHSQNRMANSMFTKYEDIMYKTNKRKLDILSQKAITTKPTSDTYVRPFPTEASIEQINPQLSQICDEIGKLKISIDSTDAKEKICHKISSLKQCMPITRYQQCSCRHIRGPSKFIIIRAL